VAGCFFTDSSGIFEAHANPDSSTVGTNGVDKTVTSTLQAAVNSEKRSQWLILVRPQGVMEVRSVPLRLLLSLI
jgi:cleavage and polyadenylation specificity factor subunit 1